MDGTIACASVAIKRLRADGSSSDAIHVPDRDGCDDVTRKMTWRPSGRNDGQVCDVSPDSSVVSGEMAPDASRRMSGPFGDATKTRSPAPFHAAPRPAGASTRSDVVPPARSIDRILPFAKNPILVMSGDQKGIAAASVPGSARVAPLEKSCSHSETTPALAAG